MERAAPPLPGLRSLSPRLPLSISPPAPLDLAQDAFYNPHAPRLLDDGETLVVMDDGTDRPGCQQTLSDAGNTVVIGCFSRAIAYHLNFEKMVRPPSVHLRRSAAAPFFRSAPRRCVACRPRTAPSTGLPACASDVHSPRPHGGARR